MRPEEIRAEEIYAALVAHRAADIDPFEAHVFASILALSSEEAAAGATRLDETCGLDSGALAQLVGRMFPGASGAMLPACGRQPELAADEASLIDLLIVCRSGPGDWTAILAAMIARRAQRPNHLWQDLGLRNRGELSRLMLRHFAPLARRNSKDMKWKKFLYRTICRDNSYSLCAAPCCSECHDFDLCFGEENGESLLARIRRDSEVGAMTERVLNHPVGFATAS